MSPLLVFLLVFANAGCACGPGADAGTADNPHAHHEMQATADTDSSACPHLDCGGCTDEERAIAQDREARANTFVEPEFDDLVGLQSEPEHLAAPILMLVATGPARSRIDSPLDSPVTRADLLLE